MRKDLHYAALMAFVNNKKYAINRRAVMSSYLYSITFIATLELFYLLVAS